MGGLGGVVVGVVAVADLLLELVFDVVAEEDEVGGHVGGAVVSCVLFVVKEAGGDYPFFIGGDGNRVGVAGHGSNVISRCVALYFIHQ